LIEIAIVVAISVVDALLTPPLPFHKNKLAVTWQLILHANPVTHAITLLLWAADEFEFL
jgi:hypothetical protein